jgi:hypothetical protein
MEIAFPIEFLVHGTPVSLAGSAAGRNAWQARVKAASSSALPSPHFTSFEPMAVTIFYFPDGEMQGDIDNIIKPILDAMKEHVYGDDRQVERVVAQKFESIFQFENPSSHIAQAITAEKPVLYVRVSADPTEDLR